MVAEKGARKPGAGPYVKNLVQVPENKQSVGDGQSRAAKNPRRMKRTAFRRLRRFDLIAAEPSSMRRP